MKRGIGNLMVVEGGNRQDVQMLQRDVYNADGMANLIEKT